MFHILMSTNLDRISIVVPTHNVEQLLREALESVFHQTYTNWEVIVIDDGSTDKSREYLQRLHNNKVRVIFHDRCGIPARLRNAGVAAATGRYVAFLDSDDLWHPEKLAAQLEALTGAPGCRWSFTHFDRIDETGRMLPAVVSRRSVPHSGWILSELLGGDVIVAMPSVMAERSLLVEAGGFDESLAFCEDYDLWLRLATRSPAVELTASLARVRTHRTNYTRERGIEAHASFKRVFEKLLSDLTEEELRRLARYRYARSLISLAGLHRRAGRSWLALRALRESLRFRPAHRAWWEAFAKTLCRPFIPVGVLTRYYNRRRVAVE
jgi:glycosyltransferase involved in cell wall biosynthesis